MAGFGITDVTVQKPGSPPPPGVRRVTVDWAALPASRPAAE